MIFNNTYQRCFTWLMLKVGGYNTGHIVCYQSIYSYVLIIKLASHLKHYIVYVACYCINYNGMCHYTYLVSVLVDQKAANYTHNSPHVAFSAALNLLQILVSVVSNKGFVL